METPHTNEIDQNIEKRLSGKKQILVFGGVPRACWQNPGRYYLAFLYITLPLPYYLLLACHVFNALSMCETEGNDRYVPPRGVHATFCLGAVRVAAD